MKKQTVSKKAQLKTEPKSKKSAIIIILSVIAVILTVLLIVFGVKSCNNDKKPSETDNPPAVTAPFPDLKGSMVYHASGKKGGDSDLYLYNFEKNTLECLTDKLKEVSDCKYADFSNDGKTVIFMAKDKNDSYGIYSLNIADKSVAKLTGDLSGCGYPAFSPDGLKIAFTKAEGENRFIYEYDTALKTSRKLTQEPGFYSYPCYSEDGKYVYFSSGTNESYNVIMRAETSSGALETVYAEEYINCYNPQIIGKDFYFTKQFNVTAENTIGVKYISESENVRGYNFNSLYYSVDSLCPVNGNYVILSSDKNSKDGSLKLFAADCNNGNMWDMTEVNKDFASGFDCTGADYFIEDSSVYNLSVSDVKITVTPPEESRPEENLPDEKPESNDKTLEEIKKELSGDQIEDAEIKKDDTLTFIVKAEGGYGNYSYSYYILKDGAICLEKIRTGLPFTEFTPSEPGEYTVKIYIEDETGEMTVQSYKLSVE